MVRTVVNKDGSITTSSEDEHELAAGPQLGSAKAAESKVVAPEDEKPAPKTRSRAEGK